MPATKEKTYNETQIAERLKELPGWYYEDGWIRRVYKTDGWPTTMMLVNAVGYLAEAAYHHPDLTVTWGRITVKLQNHAAGGITRQGLRAGAEDRGGRPLAADAAARSRARRTSGCGRGIHDRAVRRSGGRADDGHGERRRAPGRVLFVTGRLAEPALRRVLDEMQPPFEADVAVLEDHGRRADDDALDRPVPRGAGRHRPRADSRPVSRATPAS